MALFLAYVVFRDGSYDYAKLSEIAAYAGLSPDVPLSSYDNDGRAEHVWSARLGTGLFGRTNCPSGNRGPKHPHEVMLGIGEGGLAELISLGFIPCPTCKPEDVSRFWDVATPAIAEKYGFLSPRDFVNKDILGYDARRVLWEDVVPLVGGVPSRLYVPSGLVSSDLSELGERFDNLGFPFEKDIFEAGHYDHDAPGHFRAYEALFD